MHTQTIMEQTKEIAESILYMEKATGKTVVAFHVNDERIDLYFERTGETTITTTETKK